MLILERGLCRREILPCSSSHAAFPTLWSCWQLQLEVDRLEELKLQNMKSVVQAIRMELAEYWDKCFYSQEQREGFSPYYDGECWLLLAGC